MAFPFREAVLAKPATFLERLDRGLRCLALFHLVAGFAVETHDVLVEGNARATRKLLQVGNAKIARDFH